MYMVETKTAMESQFVTADLIKESKTKRLVVIDPGNYEQTDFGSKLSLKVRIDGKEKIWRPNKESVANLQSLGADTEEWLGKPIQVKVEKRSGKEAVIAYPTLEAIKNTAPKQPANEEDEAIEG